jgi:nicotinate-nucleotide--dimethylbenzimidazole phosphoribosyltransferase
MATLLSQTLKMIKPLAQEAMAQAQAHQDRLTKPPGSLGRLEELSVKLAGIQGKALPTITQKAVITMAADHGVVAEKIGNWPQEVTAQMVLNFLSGGAGINVIARQVGARVIVVDLGVATELEPNPQLWQRRIAAGTQNIARGPAMTEQQAIRAVEVGIDIIAGEVAKGLDIIGTGDMGIGNTTASAAICSVMTGNPVSEVTGRGTGLSDEQLAHKTSVVERAISVNYPHPDKPLEVLAKLGGFEIAGLVGVMLAGASHRIPVVIDGFISGAAALIATAISPTVKDYLIAAHLSAEAGHRLLLQHLGLKPLLDLEMRLGEGTGAALGIFLAEAAARILTEMATFTEAGVSERNT